MSRAMVTTKRVQVLAATLLFGASIAVGSGCGHEVSETDPEAAGGGGNDGGGCEGADCPVACPSESPNDDQVKGIVDLHCSDIGSQCSSLGANNGCGYCSVTCSENGWKATDQELCHPAPFGC